MAIEGFGEASFTINVGGQPVTNRIAPFLEHLETECKTGHETDTARLILNDKSGQLLLPAHGDPIVICLGWLGMVVMVFTGVVNEVRSRGSRVHGRLLAVTAHSADTGSKIKEPLEFHADKTTLAGFMGQAAQKAGLSFVAQGAIGAIQRDYWAAGTESFIHLGQRLAHEVGAAFKIIGGQAFMWPLNSPFDSIQGGDGSIIARWGDGDGSGNLIEWDIAPIVSRPRYAQSRARWYDPKTAAWKEKTKQSSGFDGSGFEAEFTHRQSRADDGEAGDTAGANADTSAREAGTGDCLIVGNPGARPDGICNVAGVRPGVDGGYRIDGVVHTLTRGVGFHTKLELKQPQGGAGEDDRGSSGGATDALPSGQGGIGHA